MISMPLLLVCALFAAGLAVFEVTARTKWVSTIVSGEVLRKLGHILSAVALAASPVILTKSEVIALCGVFVVALGLLRVSHSLRATQTVGRVTWGELWFPIGVSICAWWALPQYTEAFAVGVLILGFADAVAALVGRRWGSIKFKVVGGNKSIQGSVAFAATSLLILGVSGVSPSLILVGYVLLLTVSEAVLPYGLDNALLPTAGALVYIATL
jgi:phytol kinase